MKRIFTITSIAICTIMFFTTAALAQGTATGPSTFHYADPGGVVYVGGPNDLINGPAPFPIDLDASGPPWRKAILSDPASGFGSGNITMIETVLNVGTEPWYDWHEQVIPDAVGAAWSGVNSVLINGLPITFNQMITGSSLTIDGFSQPVLPGDVLVIEKELYTTANLVGPGKKLVDVLEYPTPEPGSASLMGVGALLLCKRRLRRNQAGWL